MSSRRSLLTGLLGATVAVTGVLAVTPSASAATDLAITEIHYDNDGTDAAEGVEVAGPAGTDLSGYSLVPYNGSGGTSYAATALSGTVDDEGSGSGAVWVPIAGLQNGAPDGVALVQGATVVELLSYEGSFAATDGAAAGTTSTDIGVAEPATSTVGHTLQLIDGAWTGPVAGSPGTINVAADPDPDPDPVGLTPIAEVQGTGEASPVAGQTVTTQGVVTAEYADPYPATLGAGGGYDGMYIQTGGTGSGADATPGASDAVFVYGANALPDGVDIGDSVEVTGAVTEFQGTTEITPAAGGVTELTEALPAVSALSIGYPTTAVDREAHEGELLQPSGDFTVTNTYGTNQYAEIDLAAGTTPLIQPTDVARPGTAAYQQVVADNAARAITLDDATSVNFLRYGQAEQDIPLPWLTADNTPRVGDAVTFGQPVVLEFRNNAWKFQPTGPVTDAGTDVVTFEESRAQNAAPQPVGGDLRLGTFNVLNYFNTTGEAFVGAGGSCTYYTDRDDNPIATDQCTPDGPRGAANDANLARQQAKIVAAINALGADIVSLEELENSIKMLGETDRDDAIGHLVDALNAAAGAGTWAYVASPAEATTPANVAEQDVIRSGFIYRPASVEPVGESDLPFGNPAFANAREPLAQAFKPVGGADSETFAVVVNHFKSKGCGDSSTGDNADVGDGQGCHNGDRTRQAQALATFASEFATARGTEKVFLTGDFNSYTQEDPMVVLGEAGYGVVESDQEGDWSYSFSGLSGSLDHVLANDAAMAGVTGADVWEINANESAAYQYSRYNYNATDLYAANQFAASDHNPEVVGIDPSATAPPSDEPVDVQILGTNDFHGRLAPAPSMATMVKNYRTQNPNTVFAAAGDLIGASTFESFIQHDKPTIDVLNAAGLDVSAVGNHEFDQGYDDLTQRVMAPYDASLNPYGGAEWTYLGANVRFKDSGDPALDGTWIQDFGGVQVGFVGAVTEHLAELVSPAGIENIEVTDIVEATNTAADDLTSEGADVVVMLVHEGAPSTDCAAMDDDPASDFGSIVTGVNANVDAVISGHTHLAYNCSFPVAEWAGRAVTERPVVSSGQYGENLNRLVFSVDPATGEVQAKTQEIVKIDPAGTPDPEVKAIVDQANADAAELGAAPLGEIAGPFNRAKYADGTTENRGGESTLGNLVAEVQRWATETSEAGAAEIAFMNPGGLRADMRGADNGSWPSTLTYKQAAAVQPFANTLVNMSLTGEQIAAVLEEQWQPAGSSRPFLRLGISEGFTYTYDPDAAAGSRILGMWLHGDPIEPTETFSVTVNSFLASGGDNFGTFAAGAGKRDTGKIDLQAMVDYMAGYPAGTPLEVDSSQRSVGANAPTGAPATYTPGSEATFELSSLSMTGPDDVVDTEVAVSIGGTEVGRFPVTTTRQAAGTPGFDEVGTASVTVTLPSDLAAGGHELVITGATTGTEARVPITVAVDNRVEATVTAPDRSVTYGKATTLTVTVTATGATPTGTVEATVAGKTYVGTLDDQGIATVTIPKRAIKPADLPQPVTLSYSGDDAVKPAEGTAQLTVKKGNVKLTSTLDRIVVKQTEGRLVVTVKNADGVPVTGKVTARGKTARVIGGKAILRLPKYATTGTKSLRITYSGSAYLNGKSVTRSVQVYPR